MKGVGSDRQAEDPLLMIPGPSDVAQEVLQALGVQVEAHYGAGWAVFYNSVVDAAKRLLSTAGELFIYAGSGHLGLDAAIGSLFEPGDVVIVVENGFFGERLEELARSHELQVIPVPALWGSAVQPDEVEGVMADHPEARGVLVVHGETSTGVLNPVKEIAALAKRRDVLTVVDAVSTAGIAPLDLDGWGIDACVTASQKGLGAPPGLVLVTVSDRGWDALAHRRTPIRGWSANLGVWRRYREAYADYQPYFITMPVNVVRALGASLRSIEAEGLERRIARHAEVSRTLREALGELGLEVVADQADALPSVTAVRVPEGRGAADVRDALVERHGILISTGLGKWADDVLRIGHMGINADQECVGRLTRALRQLFA